MTGVSYKSVGAGLCLKMQENGIFEGYGSVFGVKDSDNDVIQPGAFFQAVQHFNKKSFEPKLLWQHRQDQPVGSIQFLEEDARGLKLKGKLLLEIQAAKEAYTLMKEGVVKGLSIGFIPILTKKGAGKVRHILHVKLFEVSLVTFPANPKAQVELVKGNAQQEQAIRTI